MDIFGRLDDIVNRYEDITAELSNPDVVNDQDRFRKLMKEQSDLQPIVDTYREYKKNKETIQDSIAMLEEEKDEEMRVQQLKYILKVAEVGSITEAAKLLFISQPSLSNSIKETEKEAGITIFLRSRTGITLTKDGAEFLGYARQVIQQMELLEDRYVTNLPEKVTFGVC